MGPEEVDSTQEAWELELQQLLQAGIDSGTPILADEEWWAERLAKLKSEPQRSPTTLLGDFPVQD